MPTHGYVNMAMYTGSSTPGYVDSGTYTKGTAVSMGTYRGLCAMIECSDCSSITITSSSTVYKAVFAIVNGTGTIVSATSANTLTADISSYDWIFINTYVASSGVATSFTMS